MIFLTLLNVIVYATTLIKFLDLVFYNHDDCNVTRFFDPCIAENSHRPALQMQCNTSQKLDRTKNFGVSFNKCYSFHRANYPVLYDLISNVDWNFLELLDDAEDACTYFYGKLYSIFDRCIPTYTLKHKNRYPPWFNSTVIMGIRRKAKFHSQFKRTNDLQEYTEFSRLRAKVNTDISRLYGE